MSDANAEASFQGVPGMERPAEGLMGGGAEGDREVEEPVEDLRHPCQWEMQSGDTGLPPYRRCGRLVPSEDDVGSEASEWEPRELRERQEREEERRGGGGGCRG